MRGSAHHQCKVEEGKQQNDTCDGAALAMGAMIERSLRSHAWERRSTVRQPRGRDIRPYGPSGGAHAVGGVGGQEGPGDNHCHGH